MQFPKKKNSGALKVYRLVPLDRQVEPVKLNSLEWARFSELMYELGCSYVDAIRSNPQEQVLPEVTLEWAEALDESLDEIVVEVYPSFSGSGKDLLRLRLPGSRTSVNVDAYHIAAQAFARLRGTQPELTPREVIPLREHPAELDFVQNMSAWLRATGGFVLI